MLFLDKMFEIISIIAIRPALTTEGEAPERITNIIIKIMEKKLEIDFPNNLSKINLDAKITYEMFVPETARRWDIPDFLNDSIIVSSI